MGCQATLLPEKWNLPISIPAAVLAKGQERGVWLIQRIIGTDSTEVLLNLFQFVAGSRDVTIRQTSANTPIFKIHTPRSKFTHTLLSFFFSVRCYAECHPPPDPPQKFELQMCECHQTINVFTAFRNQRNAKYSVFTKMYKNIHLNYTDIKSLWIITYL